MRTGRKRGTMRDITYCTRDCANYKCRRNKEALEPSLCNYAYYGMFEACEEFIKKEEKNE